VEKKFQKLGSWLIRRPWPLIACLAVMTVFLGWRLSLSRFDNSNDIWLNEANSAMGRLTGFRELFGNEDFIYLVFDGQDFFAPKTVALLAELAEDLATNLPFVKNVRWLGNAEYLEGQDGSLIVASFFDLVGRGLSRAELVERILAEKIYLHLFFDEQAEVIAMSVDFEPYPADVIDPAAQIRQALSRVLAAPEYQDLNVKVVGPPILSDIYNDLSYSEALKFLLLGLLIMTIILSYLGRSLKAAFVPLFIIIISLIWSFGLTELLGYDLNVFVILLPVLLCCSTVGVSTHIIDIYRQNRRLGQPDGQALVEAMGRSGAPCLITALTTAAGFLSFLTSDIPPCRDMGVYAAIGVMTAYVLSVILVALFYAPRRNSRSASGAKRIRRYDAFDGLMTWIYRLNMAGRRLILTLFAGIFILAFYGYSRVETESNTIGMLSPSLPLRQAYDFVDERIGGTMSVELIFDSQLAEGIKEPAFLERMERLRAFLEGRPEVTRTISVIDLLKNIGQALHDGDPAYWTLPKTRASAAQYLLLYELADGRELDKLISFDGQKARLTARAKSMDTRQVRVLTEAIETEVGRVFGDPAQVTLTGGLDWTRSMNDQMARGQRQTFTSAFITLTLIMSIAMRSLKTGLLSLAPNVVPVLATIGLAGSLGLYIDIPLLSFSPIIIGLIIDDTTHFLYRFREVFLDTGSYALSLKRTLATVGRPLLFTTLTVVGAFSFLLWSNLSGVWKFGGLGVVAFILAIVADFTLLPAILLTFKPFGPDRATEPLTPPLTAAIK
jgi:predicted RND superfamily exporter protein